MQNLGFSHAGTEVWYFKGGDNLEYKICPAPDGKLESKECANTVIFTSIIAHLHYLGLYTRFPCDPYHPEVY
jgi:hypothetical protein